MQGWLKLYRKSIESAVFQNANLWKVWCYCLIRANHKETNILFNGKQITLQPGQFITGRFEGAKDCNMSPSTFRNQLGLLKKLQNMDIISDNKKSIITLINWACYQGEDYETDSNPDNKRTTKGQQKDTDKNVIMKEDNNKPKRKIKNDISIKNLPEDLETLYYKNEYFFITKDYSNELKDTFKLNDDSLKIEFYKMGKWLDTNKPKKDYTRFITNWLSRTKSKELSSINTPKENKQDFQSESGRLLL